MSKGHAAAALYAVLAETAFIPLEWLETFYCNGGELLGHVTHGVPGVEFSTGSLGHGLPVATGLALAGKRDKLPYRVFCILSDGECNEGATWESALFCSHHKLDNLIVIIDYNKMQAMGTTHDVLELEPISDKWNAFGWGTREVDGHEHRALKEALEELPFSPEKPSCLIAHTTKGKGVSFMENQVAWHYKAPNAEELHRALRQLEPC
jgi:transketolase